MIETIIALAGKWLAPIAAGLGSLLVVLFQRWRVKKLKAQVRDQADIIKAHEKIEEVHRQDVEQQTEMESVINQVKEKVSHAETQEQAGEAVTEGLNQFFRSGK